jgi:prepilin signal peptidase PulO-like enzyme (type II secretory pathway)
MFYFFVFIIGICWGSFANVLIDRGQKEKSILGRSKCDYCHYKLRWFDNIPILSFLILRGKCRKCENKLSWQYPIIEFLTGLVFIVTWFILQKNSFVLANNFEMQDLLVSIYFLGVVYLLWVILVWDFKYMIIPDFLIIIGLGLTFFYKIYQMILQGNYSDIFNNPLAESLLGGIVLSGFFGLLYWYSKGKWIGGGDVKLGFWLGMLVSLKMVYFLILISYTLGAVIAIFLLLFFKKKMKSEIPFGPFLIIATWVIIFYQDYILKIWNNLI